MRSRRSSLAAGLALWAAAWAAPPRAGASSASLQFTVPAPDPVQAGETVLLQALAVNTGSDSWPGGSYYWVAEIYDLEFHFLARTDQISPRETVASGGVASVSIPFPVPATATGRRLYRIYLVKDTQTLIESERIAFQIIEKPIPPPPEVVDYRVEGNITVSLKDSSVNRWRHVNGSTAVNLVGKIKDSSYLFNANLLHQPGKPVDPFVLLFTYYAPWGRVYAGDISPAFSPLSVNGLGLRGLLLEQQKGPWEWSVLGGQSITSQAGTSSVNGRYARSLYALRLARDLPARVRLALNAFQSADESGSLSTDPKSNNFRGPTLVPQKNRGAGLTATWQPAERLTLAADYQKNDYFADVSKPKASDAAQRAEARWDGSAAKIKAVVQRAGTSFVAFGAPSVVGDRQTMELAASLFPASWCGLNLAGSQFTDNLKNNPAKLTTTQRTLSAGTSLQAPSKTSLGLNASLNTSKGKPASALDNQTLTAGLSVGQALRAHSLSLSALLSQFRDKNKIAHDLDTMTLGLGANVAATKTLTTSWGATRSQTKDKADGSSRVSQSLSASAAAPLRPAWRGQLFGSLNSTKNTSKTFPSDVSSVSMNAEATWQQTAQANLTLGLGYNRTKDAVTRSNSVSEAVLSTRYSYSF